MCTTFLGFSRAGLCSPRSLPLRGGMWCLHAVTCGWVDATGQIVPKPGNHFVCGAGSGRPMAVFAQVATAVYENSSGDHELVGNFLKGAGNETHSAQAPNPARHPLLPER